MDVKRILLKVFSTSLVVMGVASCAVQPGSHDFAVEVSKSYIVQSDSAESTAHAVLESGGLVTHELLIIRAVGAQLTTAQRQQLQRNDAVRRIYEDTSVSTSSICGVSGTGTIFEDNKFRWLVTNTGSSTVTIGSLSVSWPTTNSTLKKIKLNGADIWTAQAEPPYVQIVDNWHDDVRRRQLAPGQTAELRFEFDADIDWAEANYSISLYFEEGCSLEFVPREMDCR
ncbi:MAG: DUF3872 domain-containing protein [Gammaproteobacteria bacterium]|nr:DUF3872 domain-containing protein [Gammaproteobacteria bacterium]MDH5304155.1 DUF3872 domain-containing protein [Gammaproteobacteria bacterium]MDH5321834.1 DUF3872 domain-containing protein [Gammaproteobacteria bacterium]